KGWDDLRIEAEAKGKTPWRYASINGNGVGIWRQGNLSDGKQFQFALPKEQITSLLRAFQKAKFGSMPAYFGVNTKALGLGRPNVETLRVALTAAGSYKSV